MYKRQVRLRTENGSLRQELEGAQRRVSELEGLTAAPGADEHVKVVKERDDLRAQVKLLTDELRLRLPERAAEVLSVPTVVPIADEPVTRVESSRMAVKRRGKVDG